MAVCLRFLCSCCCLLGALQPTTGIRPQEERLSAADCIEVDSDSPHHQQGHLSSLLEEEVGGQIAGALDLIHRLRDNNESAANLPAGSSICRNEVKSNLWLYDNLLEYHVDHLRETQCDEMLLVMVQREVMRVLRMEAVIGKKKFKELFPADYRDSTELKELLKGVIGTALNAVHLPATAVSDAAKATCSLDKGCSREEGKQKYGKGWLAANTAAKIPELLEDGAEVLSDVWEDVPVGLILEIYNYSNLYGADWTGLEHSVEAKDFRDLAEQNSAWNSPGTLVGKFLLGAGLALGGILSHGTIFALLALGVDATITKIDDKMLRKVHEGLSNHILFVLAELGAWEHKVFTSPHRQSCDSARGQTCDEGFACMTNGIFHCLPDEIPLESRMRPKNEVDRKNCTPVCVRAPAPPGKEGSNCSADVDCTSGVCDYWPTVFLRGPLLHSTTLSRLVGKCV